MTELINLVQLQEPGSALIELYEIVLNETYTIYFHPGLDSDLTPIQFDGNTYVALPAELDGVEYNPDGATNRPTLTIANVLSTFSDLIYDFFASPPLRFRNEDLVGKRFTKRTTLKKYLDGEPGSSSPVIEFPKKKFIIDRIAQESKDAVTFELAVPFDLSGILLPNRIVAGKYCGWIYQGSTVDSGCSWAANSKVNYADGSGGVNSHKAYFTKDDIPIIPTAQSGSPGFTGEHETYTTYSPAATYNAGEYVEYSNTVWKAVKTSQGELPGYNSVYWIRGDVCGKKLSSCKCRFQFIPANPSSTNSYPSDTDGVLDLDTTKVLPFGAFPGSRKFR